MWPDDDAIEAALRGEYAANPAADVNWARIMAGLGILAAVAIIGTAAVLLTQIAGGCPGQDFCSMSVEVTK